MRGSKVWVVMTGALLVLAPLSSALASHGAVTVHVPGYSYSPFVITSVSGDDLELDAEGNLYLCQSGNIHRVTPEGSASPWSTATASDLTFTDTGTAYGAGRALCHCIVSISALGTPSTLHADSHEWAYVALGEGGTLYATIFAGDGQGLYAIDRVTGTPTAVVNGGPGPGGSGIYRNMIVGSDGKLYTGSRTPAYEVFRLDGTQFAAVGSPPRGGNGLAQDNQGILYVGASVESQTGSFLHEVWMLDPGTGSSTLLASGSHGMYGIAYDLVRERLYVWISGGEVYFLSKSVVPTRKSTWGALKSIYR